jgi:hypothetical protein
MLGTSHILFSCEKKLVRWFQNFTRWYRSYSPKMIWFMNQWRVSSLQANLSQVPVDMSFAPYNLHSFHVNDNLVRDIRYRTRVLAQWVDFLTNSCLRDEVQIAPSSRANSVEVSLPRRLEAKVMELCPCHAIFVPIVVSNNNAWYFSGDALGSVRWMSTDEFRCTCNYKASVLHGAPGWMTINP